MRTRSSGRPIRPGHAALVAATALAAFPAAASALTPPPPEPSTQSVTEDGWPRLAADAHTPGSSTTWSRCPPDGGGCTTVATGPGHEPGPTEAGTTFASTTTTADGRSVHARTKTWRGRLAPAAAPALVGEPRIGRHVDTQPGSWDGGWGDEQSLLGVRACPTAAGTDCRAVSSAGIQPGRGPALVDPAYADWYLGAYETRISAFTAFPAIALHFPFGEVSPHRAPAPGPTVVAGPLVGPVPAERPGVPPSVTGTLAVGRKVTPRAGTWPDAPADGRISTAVRVCPTRQDTPACRLLNDLAPAAPFAAAGAGEAGLAAPNARVTIDERYLGWYAGAVDRRARDGAPAFPELDRRPEAVPPPGSVVQHGALFATPIRLGFTPRATLVRRVAGRPRTLRLGTIRCSGRCVAHVTLRWGRRTVVRRIVVDGSSARITLGRARLGRARSVRVTVRYDDHPALARRTVRVA